MPFPVGVVDLGDDAAQLARGVVAPEQAQRVEDVPEDAGAGQHGDPAAVERDPLGGKVALDVAAQRPVRVAEVVRHARSRPAGPEPAREPGEGIDVDVPAVAAVGEGVVQRGAPHMRDGRAVDGGRCAHEPSAGTACRSGSTATARYSSFSTTAASSHVAAEPRRGLDAGEGAVLVEAPAVVGAGEGQPVIAERQDPLLGRQGIRGVLRVLVDHALDHGVVRNQLGFAQADDVAPAGPRGPAAAAGSCRS